MKPLFFLISIFILTSCDSFNLNNDSKRGELWKKDDFWVDKFDDVYLQNLIVKDSLIYGNTIDVGGSNNFLYCLDLSSGKVKWRFPTERFATQPVEFYKDFVFYSDYLGKLSKLDNKGELIWEVESPAPFGGFRVNTYDGTIIINSVVNGAYELNQETGLVLKRYFSSKNNCNGWCTVRTPIFNGSKVIFSNVEKEGEFYTVCLSSDDDSLLWERPTGKSEVINYHAYIVDSNLIMLNSSNILRSISVNSGKLNWATTIPKKYYKAQYPGKLVFGSKIERNHFKGYSGESFTINLADGKISSKDLPPVIHRFPIKKNGKTYSVKVTKGTESELGDLKVIINVSNNK